MYKFILEELTNNWFNTKDFILTCSLNNNIPYILRIYIMKPPARRRDYYLNVTFESTDTNHETYSQFNGFVYSSFLNKHFDYIFKSNSDNVSVPLEIKTFLKKKTIRQTY